MSKRYRKFEVAVNILIIAAAILTISILARKFLFPTSSDRAQPKSPAVGSNLSLADFDWSKSKKNLVLVLKKGCHFCTDSAEFYIKLIKQAQAKNVAVVAVLPDSKTDAENYLNGLGLGGIQFRQAQLAPLNVGGAPTVILTNEKGEVRNVWLGRLSPDKENEVLGKIDE